MSESKGCLGWIVATIGWFVLWGYCMSIGYTYNISPFVVLLILLFITIILIVLGVCLYRYSYNKHLNRVNEIQDKYRLAFKKYIDTNKHIEPDYFTGKISKLSDLKIISRRKDAVWEHEEKELEEQQEKKRIEWKLICQERKENADRIRNDYPDGYAEWEKSKSKTLTGVLVHSDFEICNAEEKIKVLDKYILGKRWKKKQDELNNYCIEQAESLLSGWGRYVYGMPYTHSNSEGEIIHSAYKVWQFFYTGTCLEELDYTHFPDIEERASWISELKDGTRKFQTDTYLLIERFISKISDYYLNKNEDDVSVTILFNYDKDWNKDVLQLHYSPLAEMFTSEKYRNFILHASINSIDTLNGFVNAPSTLSSGGLVVIVDVFTENDELKKLCQRIISSGNRKTPVITYISLLKAFDKDEMVDLIERKKKKLTSMIEEFTKKIIAQKELCNATSSWDILADGLHFSYLFYYYPTTCDFAATEEEWSNRWLVWDFKNTPDKTSAEDHQEVLDRVIPMLKNKLISTFGTNNLKYLTLVCIPASSQIKTQARYEEFSNRICDETGMINAYPHISVVTEKEERRSGGTSIDTNKLSFDEDFFKGKNVLLFDDVITRGDSMRTFKRKMESLGAIVVGGVSLGKTKHERPNPPVFDPLNV